MDRAITVEERIRRAEEIYEKRKRKENQTEAQKRYDEIKGKEDARKKDIKLLKKIIIQLVICMIIYFTVYTIQNNKYIFSEEFINKANEV